MKKKKYNSKFMKILKMITLLGIGVTTIYSTHNPDPNYTKRKVEKNEYRYSLNYGWIDLGHLLPEGPKKLVNDIKSEGGETYAKSDSFDITYFQRMGGSKLGVGIYFISEGKYRIKKGLDEKELESIAFDIFKEISENFEKSERKFPFVMIPRIRKSSYAEGHLVSNSLSFYGAVNDIPYPNLVDLCDFISKEESLELINEGKYGQPSNNWEPNLRINKKNSINNLVKIPKQYKNNSYRAIGNRNKFIIRKN